MLSGIDHWRTGSYLHTLVGEKNLMRHFVQTYGHVKHGWAVLCYISTACFVIGIIPVFCYAGDDPLLSKMLHCKKRLQGSLEQGSVEKERAADNLTVHVS